MSVAAVEFGKKVFGRCSCNRSAVSSNLIVDLGLERGIRFVQKQQWETWAFAIDLAVFFLVHFNRHMDFLADIRYIQLDTSILDYTFLAISCTV